MSLPLLNAKKQYIDANGNPLAGGYVNFYQPGTLTRINTWQDQALSILNTNPVQLDAQGGCVAWIADSTSVREIVTDSLNNTIWDQVTAIADGSIRPDLASTASGKGASLVGFQQSGTGAVPRTVGDRLLDTVSVFDFMSLAQIADVRAGTLAQDVTTVVQAALNACAGKRLFFPAGWYKLTAGLACSAATYIVGAGQKSTFLQFTLPVSSVKNLISVNAAHTSTWYGFGIADLIIIDKTSATGNTAVYVENVIDGLFQNVGISGSHNGYSFSNGLNKIVNNNIGDLGGDKPSCVAVQATGSSCGVGIYDTLVQSTTVVGQQIGTGYLFQGGASPTMHSANTYGCAIGCRITAVGAQTLWPELVNCQFDTGSDTGLLIDCGTGGSIYGLSIINLWTGTNTNYGVHILPGAGIISGVNFSGGRVFSNGLNGVFIEGGSGISLCDMHISGNGSSTHSGVFVAGPVNGLVVTGNKIGQEASYSNTQTYGVQVGAVAASNVTITGNDLSGNITDGLVNSSTTPSSVWITGNVGYSANGLIAPTLANSWVNNGAPSGGCYYYKDSSNVVHVQGVIKGGTIATAAFTLPAGFRPAGDQYFACVSNGVFGFALVSSSTGQVIPQAGSNVYFSLCGISFKAEQ